MHKQKEYIQKSYSCRKGVVKPFFKLLNQIETKGPYGPVSKLMWPLKIQCVTFFLPFERRMTLHLNNRLALTGGENIHVHIDIYTMICQCIFTIPLPSPRVNLFNPPVNLRHHNRIHAEISPSKTAPFFDFTYPKEAGWLKSPQWIREEGETWKTSSHDINGQRTQFDSKSWLESLVVSDEQNWQSFLDKGNS